MYHIVLDLEFNQSYKINHITKRLEIGEVNHDLPQEIIEIGAVKLDDDLNVIDTFRMFVKPAVYTKISPRIAKLTKISNGDLDFSFDFSKCMMHFKSWISEDFRLYTWGKDDVIEIKRHCMYFNVEYNWIDSFVDLQYVYAKSNDLTNLPSLKKCISENMESNKRFHRALNDAMSTADVLRKLLENGLDINHIYSIGHIANSNPIRWDKLIDDFDISRLKHECPSCGNFINGANWRKNNSKKIFTSCGICKDCNIFIAYRAKVKTNNNGDIVCDLNSKLISQERYDKIAWRHGIISN